MNIKRRPLNLRITCNDSSPEAGLIPFDEYTDTTSEDWGLVSSTSSTVSDWVQTPVDKSRRIVRFEMGDGRILYPASQFMPSPICDLSGERALIDLGFDDPVYVMDLIDPQIALLPNSKYLKQLTGFDIPEIIVTPCDDDQAPSFANASHECRQIRLF